MVAPNALGQDGNRVMFGRFDVRIDRWIEIECQGVGEGTMILMDWGICRIHKVPIWLRANMGTVFRDPYISSSGVFPTALL